MNGEYDLSSRAELDLSEAWLYVARDSIPIADRLIDAIHEKLKLLGAFPFAGEARTEFGPNIRVFPAGRYVIYYRPRERGVSIVRILHGARDIHSLHD